MLNLCMFDGVCGHTHCQLPCRIVDDVRYMLACTLFWCTVGVVCDCDELCVDLFGLHLFSQMQQRLFSISTQCNMLLGQLDHQHNMFAQSLSCASDW